MKIDMISLQLDYTKNLREFASIIRDIDDNILEKMDEGYWKLDIDSEYLFEISKTGYIRITHMNPKSTDIGGMFAFSANKLHQLAGVDIQKFDTSLLIEAPDPAKLYLNEKQSIKEFGKKHLNSTEIQYHELGENTISITFANNTVFSGGQRSRTTAG